MLPATHNLQFYQGDTWEFSLTLTKTLPDNSVIPFDLTDYEVKAQIRKRANLPEIILEFNCETAIKTDGIIVITAQNAQTSLIAAGEYVWDLQLRGIAGSVLGKVRTYVAGTVSVTAEVTRP